MPEQRRRASDQPARTPSWLVNGVALVVTAVWAVSFIADIAVDDYSPSPFVHAAFLIVLGALFGVQLVQRNGGR